MTESPIGSTTRAERIAHRLAELRNALEQVESECRATINEVSLESIDTNTTSSKIESNISLSDRELAIRARHALAQRRWRDRCFAAPELLGEPTWDILLELFIKHAEATSISVSSAAYASYVPLSTALRYIVLLETRGWVTKAVCSLDKRRSFLQLTPEGLSLMRRALAGN